MSIEGARKSHYFVFQMIVPLIFIVFMSWSVFWIDPSQTGTQITVAITAMLTLIAFRFAAGITLPRFDYITRLDYFILISNIMIFGALVEVIISSWLARHNRLTVARGLDVLSRLVFPLAFILISAKILLLHFWF